MRVGYGTSTERPVLQMNWQEVEAKIRSQVVNGTYMGANEAYLTDEAERDRIAGHLFFFFRDGMGELPEELGLKAGNYPEAHARMIEYLSTKEGVELVASHMDQALPFVCQIQTDHPVEEITAYVDKAIIELFINDGEQACTRRFYLPKAVLRPVEEKTGAWSIDIKGMRSIW